MINEGLFSSKTDEWATPKSFYEELNKEFDFSLDPCATDLNHKCNKYFTKEDNGLEKSWGGGIEFTVIHPMGERYLNG